MSVTNVTASQSRFDFPAFYRKYGTFIIFIAIFILASVFTKNFFSQANLTNVVRQMVVVTLLALGVTFVIILGHIDVSLGSVMALAGCVSCQVMRSTQNIWLAVLVGLAIGLIVGLMNGLIVTMFSIPAFIMTLAMTTVARGSVLLFTGGRPITRLGNFSVIGQGHIAGIPIVFIILGFFLALSWFLLNHTRFGRYIYAVGGNRAASIASGIDADSVVRKAFLFNGLLTATAGIVLMSRMNSGQPAAGVGYEFDAITAVVVGGTSLAGGSGTILGTFIGSMIIAVINNNLNLLNVHSYWQQIAKGLIILVAVIIDVYTKRSKK